MLWVKALCLMALGKCLGHSRELWMAKGAETRVLPAKEYGFEALYLTFLVASLMLTQPDLYGERRKNLGCQQEESMVHFGF